MNHKTLSNFWKNNSLVIVPYAFFALTVIAMSIAGYGVSNDEHVDRQHPTESYISYIMSGDFVEGVFENWLSEFLAFGALIVLSIKLRERGLPESQPVGKRYSSQTASG